MRSLSCLLVLAISSHAFAAGWNIFSSNKKSIAELANDKHCSSTREYVSTLEYLRDEQKLVGSEAKARYVADEVSKSCTGAAKRFISTAKLLNKIEFNNEELLKMAMNAAKASEEKSESFKIIFAKSYFDDELDLNVDSALKIAEELSFSFKGDASWAKEQFVDIVDYCADLSKSKFSLGKAKMSINKIECAKLASDLIQNSLTEPKHLAKDFIEIYEYLIIKKKSELSQAQAISIAKEVLQFGPTAKDNFFQAYEYAENKKGLAYSAVESVNFAKKMAARSLSK